MHGYVLVLSPQKALHRGFAEDRINLFTDLLALRLGEITHRRLDSAPTAEPLHGLEVNATRQELCRIGSPKPVGMYTSKLRLLCNCVAIVPHVRVAVAIAVSEDPLALAWSALPHLHG